MNNLALTSQVGRLQGDVALERERTTALSRTVAMEDTEVADLENPQARRYGAPDGQVLVSNGRVYLLMQDLPMPPRGRVYQAWALPRGARAMIASVRFIPDPHGIAIVALDDVNASETSAVAASVEPEAGSKAPTGRLVLDVNLGG